jgi:cytochrome c biogenesis factor
MKNNKFLWRSCVVAVALIIVATYSPLVMKVGKIEPFFMGMPYTLWLSILLTVLLVVLVYIGGMAMPNDEEGEL